MKFVILLIFISTECIFSLRSNQYPALENVYDKEFVSEEESEDLGHLVFKKSISTHPSYDNSVSSEGVISEPCRLSLPTMDFFPIQDNSDEDPDLPMDVIPPRVPSIPNILFDHLTTSDLEYLSQVPGYGSYNGVSSNYDMPDFNPSAEPAYDVSYNGVSSNGYNMPYMPNVVPTVRFLPPVSTRILESIPETPDNEDDSMNYLSNDVYFPPYVRAVRSREDFLEQLEKDTTIPNILPTMPYPYMRASLPSYQGHQGVPGPIAIFPPRSGSDCGLPFLLNCSPNIYQGSLRNNMNNRNYIHSAQPTYDGAVPAHLKS